jgi:branched-chain amino acid transport system permease protein
MSISSSSVKQSSLEEQFRDFALNLVKLLGIVICLVFPLVMIQTIDDHAGLQLLWQWDLAASILMLVTGLYTALYVAALGEFAPAFMMTGAVTAFSWMGFLPHQGLSHGGAFLGLATAGWIFWKMGKETAAQLPLLQSAQRAFSAISHHEVRSLMVLLGIAFLIPFMPDIAGVSLSSAYILGSLVLIFTYILLGWGLNIIVGYAGLLDLGYIGFYAVGAYVYALLSTHYDVSFWLCLPLSALITAGVGVLLGLPVLRLRGDYFAIVTLGFGEIVRILLINLYWITGGSDGVVGIPRPSFFGLAVFKPLSKHGETLFYQFMGLSAFSNKHWVLFLYYLGLGLLIAVGAFAYFLRKSILGRAWEALREDDIACAALGINRTVLKLSAFAMSAGIAGIAGAFFAARQGFISPESFTFMESAMVLAIVVLGGMGSLLGIVLASIVLIGLPEVFRDFAEYRMIIFGLGLVLIMIVRPQGLISVRVPSVSLDKEDSL